MQPISESNNTPLSFVGGVEESSYLWGLQTRTDQMGDEIIWGPDGSTPYYEPYFFLKGAGIPQSMYRAIKLAVRASEMGNDVAMFHLKTCPGGRDGLPMDSEALITSYQIGAQNDNPIAMWCLGFCSEYGFIVKKDIPQAIDWYKKAASLGDSEAGFSLCLCLHKGVDTCLSLQEMVDRYKFLAKLCHSGAMYNLALCCEQGVGVSQDMEKASSLFSQAARLSEAEARCNLGFCYERGFAIPQDSNKAVEYFRRAHELNYPRGSSELGFCYDTGFGVPLDRAKARALFNQGFTGDNCYAILGLAYNYYFAEPQYGKDTLRLCRLAASKGNLMALTTLGYFFEKGRIVTKDTKAAMSLYQKGVQQGCAESMYSLSILLASNCKEDNDRERAVTLCRESAKFGFTSAMRKLGKWYLDGFLVEKSFTEAKTWFEKGKKDGDKEATGDLGCLLVTYGTTPKEKADGRKLIQEVATARWPRQICSLGTCYKYGMGGVKDLRQGWKLHLLAATLGVADAKIECQNTRAFGT